MKFIEKRMELLDDGNFVENYIIQVYEYELSEIMQDLEAQIEQGGGISHLRCIIQKFDNVHSVRSAGRNAKSVA